MTNLEEFLNNKFKSNSLLLEPISGSFNCQVSECNETVYEGVINRDTGRLSWVCSQAHESSVVI